MIHLKKENNAEINAIKNIMSILDSLSDDTKIKVINFIVTLTPKELKLTTEELKNKSGHTLGNEETKIRP